MLIISLKSFGSRLSAKQFSQADQAKQKKRNQDQEPIQDSRQGAKQQRYIKRIFARLGLIKHPVQGQIFSSAGADWTEVIFTLKLSFLGHALPSEKCPSHDSAAEKLLFSEQSNYSFKKQFHPT